MADVIPLVARRRPNPNDCPHCHGVALDMTGGRCLHCNNTGRIRPPKADPAITRQLGGTLDDAYEVSPAGVMNDSTVDWRVYVEPSTIEGRYDIYLQDKIHPAKPHKRVCVYHNCKYSDIRLFLIHLTSCEPLSTLCADKWRPRPF